MKERSSVTGPRPGRQCRCADIPWTLSQGVESHQCPLLRSLIRPDQLSHGDFSDIPDRTGPIFWKTM